MNRKNQKTIFSEDVLDDATINAQIPESASRASMLGLLGVAEPCALALSEKGRLVMKKTVFGRVTIAIGE